MRGMKLAVATGAMAAALCGAAAAKDRNLQCDVNSDYDLSITPKSVILTRASSKTGTPKAIVMRQGRLFVDDRWVTLTPEDSKRIAQYEQEVRDTMPLAQQIGRDAADIAFTALGEVAAGLSSDPKSTQAHLDKARVQLDQRLAHAVTANRFNGNDLGNGIAHAIGEVLPVVIGDIVGGAVSAAFSGDEARLARMNNLDKEIERRVQPRADQLEVRAESLCRRMETLDSLDDAMTYRLPDGRRLDLIDAKVEIRDVSRR
jgi:hypothetical protein